jgi:hypothetical protein
MVLQPPSICASHKTPQSQNTVIQPLAYPGGWGFKPPPPNLFRSFDKAESNSQFRGKYILRT